MRKSWSAVINKEDLPLTAGQALKRLAGLTKAQIRSAKFRKDGICGDGRQLRVTDSLWEGCTLTVALEDAPEDGAAGKVLPVYRPLTVLYEDEDLLAVHKEAGVPVQPSHGHYDDTLANAVAWYLGHGRHTGGQEETGSMLRGSAPADSTVQVRAVGRLDADTSGIVLFARNKVACERLSRRGAVEKTYFALTAGEGAQHYDVLLPIRKRQDELNRMEVKTDGLTEPAGADGWMCAITHADRKDSGPGWTLYEVRIETGRTHQIRVHMSGIGHPLLGDPIYGAWDEQDYKRLSSSLGRAALHCRQVRFRQPFSGEYIEIEDPLPADMRSFICGRSDENGEEA